MLKKLVLSAMLAISTLAIAQVNLDLNLTISHEEITREAIGSVIINENEVASIVFDNLESLIIDLAVQSEDGNALVQAQFFQKMENDELLPIVENWLAVEVPFGAPATFTINEENGNGSLVLTVVPSAID